MEASAPASIHLAGGAFDRWPAGALPAGALAVTVAIDRRATCRVESGYGGVRVESKDTLQKVDAADSGALPGRGVPGLLAFVLGALGVRSGVRVTTHSRAPGTEASGVSAAVAVAAVAALSRALARPLEGAEIVRLAGEAMARGAGHDMSPLSALAARDGGVLAVSFAADAAGAERLGVDPALVEESLLLVRSGAHAAPVARGPFAGEALAVLVAAAARVRRALAEGRGQDVAAAAAGEWEAWRRLDGGAAASEGGRITEIARAGGGAAIACAAPSDLVAVWASPGTRGPGPRERVAAALEVAGFRAVSVRVDLRGLAVEG